LRPQCNDRVLDIGPTEIKDVIMRERRHIKSRLAITDRELERHGWAIYAPPLFSY
jgi:hypothetical protein